MRTYQPSDHGDERTPGAAGALAPGKRTLTGGLPPRLAAHAGARLGQDFSSVTVHQDGSAERLGTTAYAQGDALHFAAGAYQPGTAAGVQMIGHELAHVAQQRAGRVQPTGARGGVAVNTDPALERDADAAGASVAQGFDFDSAFDFGAVSPSSVSAAGIAQGTDLAPDPAPATPASGGAASAPAAATAASAPPEVMARVGAEFVHADDVQKQRRYRITSTGGFLLVGTTVEFVSGGEFDGPWKTLCAYVIKHQAEIPPTAPPPPQSVTGAPAVAPDPWSLEGVTSAISETFTQVSTKVSEFADSIGNGIDELEQAIREALGWSSDPEASPEPEPASPEPEPAAPEETPFFSQRDNETGKDGAETIGQSNRVVPDKECNVTTLAMQLVALAGDAQTVNTETLAKLEAAGGSGTVDEQPEDLILKLFIAWGDAYWKQVCNDPANASYFPKMAKNTTFYQYYSDPAKNTEGYGWHQIGQCLNWVGQQYSFAAKGPSGYSEKKADGSLDTTSADYYRDTLRPKLDAGAAIMLSTKLSGGHIVLLVGIDDTGLWINDPYGVKIGGPAANSSGYVKNNDGSPKTAAKLFDTYAANVATRLKKNPELAAIAADPVARAQPVANWGEKNYFTFDEVTTYDIGKWNSVLEAAT